MDQQRKIAEPRLKNAAMRLVQRVGGDDGAQQLEAVRRPFQRTDGRHDEHRIFTSVRADMVGAPAVLMERARVTSSR
jgi:hypothetical protein